MLPSISPVLPWMIEETMNHFVVIYAMAAIFGIWAGVDIASRGDLNTAFVCFLGACVFIGLAAYRYLEG
jgi:hypothetical protein